jgi:hypothetical protein
VADDSVVERCVRTCRIANIYKLVVVGNRMPCMVRTMDG